MHFAKVIEREFSKKLTENGAMAFDSLGESSILDLYSSIGGMRDRQKDISVKFADCLKENPLLATKLMFYTRDIRGGLGERNSFYIMLNKIAFMYPSIIKKNLEKIPFYGRWDDVFCLIDTPLESFVFSLIAKQLVMDEENMIKNEPISLLAKWMPSINTSSKDKVVLAKRFAKEYGISQKDYRKFLSSLREYLNVLETRMSKKEWDKITYNQVPSRAMTKYRKSFYRHDEDRFTQYISDVKQGTETIKAGTLYPYDIVEKYMYSNYYGRRAPIDDVLEVQWKALPNYIEVEENVIIMADVSGSMCGRPMASSVGLAIYFAERNKGAYHNLFMTFSGRPEFVKLKGETLLEKVHNAKKADWGGNTNLESAFMKILDLAIENRVSLSEMPKAIVIISDMEIDYCVSKEWSFYEEMKNRFATFGYKIPNIVFWNVEARHDTFLVDGNRKGVQLVSGQSASTFKNVIASIGMTPYDAMINVLNGERYSSITL